MEAKEYKSGMLGRPHNAVPGGNETLLVNTTRQHAGKEWGRARRGHVVEWA